MVLIGMSNRELFKLSDRAPAGRERESVQSWCSRSSEADVCRRGTGRRKCHSSAWTIQGGSNGGLLMGVQMTQHPELWSVVDIQVPLLDLLRFESIAAGTSWVGEYGSVANKDEKNFLA